MASVQEQHFVASCSQILRMCVLNMYSTLQEQMLQEVFAHGVQGTPADT